MVTLLPPLKIIYATRWFNQIRFLEDEDIGKDCPIPDGYAFNESTSWCTLTSSEKNMEDASGLIIHAPDAVFGGLPKHVKNQPWILESLEAPLSSLFRADPTKMIDFDYLASYSFNAAFFFSYFSPAIMDVANRPLPKNFIKSKTKKAPILWIAKNCNANSGRQIYIKKLMEYVDVHSYGDCLNNMEFPEDKSRLDLIGEYKFYLAAENCNCDDYATEKLFDTLMMSTVPIVDGPPSYEGYIPSERSVIHMDAYPDPQELADYINYLDGNDTAYLEYLAFRQDAINVAPKDRLGPSFIGNWSDTMAHKERTSYCSVCRGLVPWWEAKLNGVDYVDTKKDDYVLVDQSCGPIGKWNYIEEQEGPPYDIFWTPRLKDEFTRPVANMSVEDQDYVISEHTITNKNNNSSSVLAAYASFVSLFILFIAFLYRESRKANRQSELV